MEFRFSISVDVPDGKPIPIEVTVRTPHSLVRDVNEQISALMHWCNLLPNHLPPLRGNETVAVINLNHPVAREMHAPTIE